MLNAANSARNAGVGVLSIQSAAEIGTQEGLANSGDTMNRILQPFDYLFDLEIQGIQQEVDSTTDIGKNNRNLKKRLIQILECCCQKYF